MKQLFLIVLIAIYFFGLFPVGRVVGQTAVSVTISVRSADGSPVVAEEVTLLRQPDYTAQTAVTDGAGQALFNVPRGLYEIQFTAALDAVSALAVAEGGMAGFGITVGDEAITYYFTFQDDGHVYFDSAPDAAAPSPIMPELEDLHFIGGAGVATPTVLPGIIVLAEAVAAGVPAGTETAVLTDVTNPPAATETMTATETVVAETTVSEQEEIALFATATRVTDESSSAQASSVGIGANWLSNWLLLFLALVVGVFVGGGAYLLSSYRRKG